MEFTIKLNSMDDAVIISKIAEKYDTDIDIRSYDNHYIVDAKSLMGILSLDLSKPIIVKIKDISIKEVITKEISKYIVM